MRFRRRWVVAAGTVAGFLAGLAACESTLRQDRVAMCRRALPALAAGAGIRFEDAGPGQLPGTAWVNYQNGVWPHQLVCRFDASGLREILTDGKPLSGPAFHMLRRYYLGSPEAEAADPSHR